MEVKAELQPSEHFHFYKNFRVCRTGLVLFRLIIDPLFNCWYFFFFGGLGYDKFWATVWSVEVGFGPVFVPDICKILKPVKRFCCWSSQVKDKNKKFEPYIMCSFGFLNGRYFPWLCEIMPTSGWGKTKNFYFMFLFYGLTVDSWQRQIIILRSGVWIILFSRLVSNENSYIFSVFFQIICLFHSFS